MAFDLTFRSQFSCFLYRKFFPGVQLKTFLSVNHCVSHYSCFHFFIALIPTLSFVYLFNAWVCTCNLHKNRKLVMSITVVRLAVWTVGSSLLRNWNWVSYLLLWQVGSLPSATWEDLVISRSSVPVGWMHRWKDQICNFGFKCHALLTLLCWLTRRSMIISMEGRAKAKGKWSAFQRGSISFLLIENKLVQIINQYLNTPVKELKKSKSNVLKCWLANIWYGICM